MRLLTRDSVPVGRHRGRPQSYRTERPLATEGIPGFEWFSSGSLAHAKFALVLLASLGVVACVPGQRLLTFQIEVDGHVAFEGIRSVSDSAPKDELWYVLGAVRFDSTGTPPSGESIDVRSSDARSSDAQGGVVVRIRHVEREMGVVRVAKLALSRTVDESWRLDGESVEVVQRAAAAGEPESEAGE